MEIASSSTLSLLDVAQWQGDDAYIHSSWFLRPSCYNTFFLPPLLFMILGFCSCSVSSLYIFAFSCSFNKVVYTKRKIKRKGYTII